MSNGAGAKPELKRALGLTALIAMGVGDILGSGVYALVGKVAGLVGAAAWTSYVLAAILAALTGLTYAELSSRFPRAGGAAHYTQEIFNNRFLTFMVMFFVALSGLFSFSTASHTFSVYALAFTDGVPPIVQTAVLPVCYIVFVAFVCIRGIMWSSVTNFVCFVVEFTALMLIILLGARYIGGVNYLEYEAVSPDQSFGTVGLVMTGAAIAFFAFIGFEDMANLAEEAKDARRTLPLAMCAAILVTTTVYILIALIAVSVISPAELKTLDTPLIDVMRKAAPWFPVEIYSIIPAFAVFNTGLLCLLMASRLFYGMASGPSSQLPRALSYVHPRWQTPVVSILVTTAIVTALTLYTSDVGVLADGATILILCVFVLLHIALLRAKLKNIGDEPYFRVPLALPACGLALSIALLLSREAGYFKVAGYLALAGSALFFVNWFILGRRNVEAVD